MIRRLRQRLRMIRYYSAPRKATPWTRAADIALVASLILAFPVAWIADRMVTRSDLAIQHNGMISRMNNGELHVTLNTSERDRGSVTSGVPIGNFQLHVFDQAHGWPVTTTIRRRPATLDLDMREERSPRARARFSPDDAIHIAITDALERDEQREMLQAWRPTTNRADVVVHRPWFGWPLASGIWWILLTVVAFLLIQFARFIFTITHVKRLAQRERFRSQGKCASCGYDMTGLEFNERCPECGNLVW